MGARYMECSSKEMTGVHEIFDTAIDIAVRGKEEEQSATHGGNGGTSSAPARRKKRSQCSIL